jgi:fructose-specific component phosphotransferase system IIB-like protein
MGREAQGHEHNGPGPSAAADVNRVSGYLAQRVFSALTRAAVSAALGRPADLLILMGGSIAAGCEAAGGRTGRAWRSGS